MFSALKKLTGSGRPDTMLGGIAPGHTAGGGGSGTVPMSDSLQKKFARGVQYNMKIIIKGDRNVGKTCLLQRLQGRAFLESYTPSDEIQVASIQWSFKSAESDVVKVEVWDVVDHGKARSGRPPPGNGALKLSNPAAAAAAASDQPALDAAFLDVYKGTHGVVLMMDITKAWTFDYLCRELPRIPQDIPVLILGNHCDMAHHRVVSAGQVIGLIEDYADRPAEIHFGDSSMRNGFGLRLLYRFLGLPFLRLQKETLLSQLQRNQRETHACSAELGEFLQSDDADYGKFIEQLSTRRRQAADAHPKSLAPAVLAHSGSGTSISSAASAGDMRPAAASGRSIVIGGGQPIVVPGQLNVTNDPRLRQQFGQPTMAAPAAGAAAAPAAITTAAVATTTTTATASMHTTVGFMTSLLGGNDTVRPSPAAGSVLSVDEFCPDGGGGLDRGFLDDEPHERNAPAGPTVGGGGGGADDSESDVETANPLVARFHDEPTAGPATSIGVDSPLHLRTAAATLAANAGPKVNPLAKGRSASFGHAAMRSGYGDEQRHTLSTSSDELDVAGDPLGRSGRRGGGGDERNVVDDNNDDEDDDDEEALGNRRRSPEGLEDPASMRSAARVEPTPPATPVDEEKSERRQRSGKKKKERNETRAERDARRADKKSKRRSGKESKSSDPDEAGVSGSPNADASYEAL